MNQHKLYSWVFGITVPVICLVATSIAFVVMQARGEDHLLMNSLSIPMAGLLIAAILVTFVASCPSVRPQHWVMPLSQAMAATGAGVMYMMAILGLFNEDMVAKGGHWFMLYVGIAFGSMLAAFALFPYGFRDCEKCPRVRPAFALAFLLFLLPLGGFSLRALGYV